MRGPLKSLALSVLMVSGAIVALAGQAPANGRILTEMLQWVLPDATSYSLKEGTPPHFTGYIDKKGQRTAIGYAWWTTELEPTDFGYEGPIKILIGMDLRGVITGIDVVQHNEPYGSWSIATAEFAEQFRGKTIRDPFRVGGDIDVISRATISNTSATRMIRNSARKIARALLNPEDVK